MASVSKAGDAKDGKSAPAPVSYIPAAALKRFADDLESDSTTNKFLEINRDRVQTFIEKPTNRPLHSQRSPSQFNRKTKIAGIHSYSFDNPGTNTKTFIHLQNKPEFQNSLGAKSRFGDGDGSFFDRWLTSDVASSKQLLDKDGLPVMKFALNEVQTGFKKHLKDFKDSKQDTFRSQYVKSYAERRAERLEREKSKLEMDTIQVPDSSQNLGFEEKPVLPALSIQIEEPHESTYKRESKLPPISSPITAVEKENYFGSEARMVFFDYYHNLSRQRMNYDINTSSSVDNKEDSCSPRDGRGTFGRTSPREEFAAKKAPIFAEGDILNPNTRIEIPVDLERFSYSAMRPHLNTVTQEEKQQLLDHLFSLSRERKDRSSGQSTRPNSARTIFLKGCVDQGILPQPSLIIRKELTTMLNISCLGFGNKVAKVLAEALDVLPALEAISIADNNLTDEGLVPIVNKLSACKSLTSVDISNNKVDSSTAEALRKYLSSPTCQMRELIMQNANVDDYEAAKFMEVIAIQNTLESLDLSHNLLGSHEFAVKKQSETAGASIGKLLRNPDCSIKTLKLAWNMIRFSSGVKLAESIRFNKSLTYLDLSFNKLDTEGTEILGNGLYEHPQLKTLKLAHNNILAKPAFVILSAAKGCDTLTELDLSENPIGEEGARSLLSLNLTHGNRIKVDIRNCTLRIKDPSCWFHMHHPRGEYELDLSSPYERAIYIELMRTVARDKDLEFCQLKYISPDDSSGNGSDLPLKIFEDTNKTADILGSIDTFSLRRSGTGTAKSGTKSYIGSPRSMAANRSHSLSRNSIAVSHLDEQEEVLVGKSRSLSRPTTAVSQLEEGDVPQELEENCTDGIREQQEINEMIVNNSADRQQLDTQESANDDGPPNHTRSMASASQRPTPANSVPPSPRSIKPESMGPSASPTPCPSVKQIVPSSSSLIKNSSVSVDDESYFRETFREAANRIFRQYDKDESGSLDKTEVAQILEQLGLEGSWTLVDKLVAIYDSDGSGCIEESEFVSFLMDLKKSYQKENKIMFANRYFYNTNDNSAQTVGNMKIPKVYLPPYHGRVKLVVDGLRSNGEFGQPVISASQIQSLLDTGKTICESSALFEFALDASTWTINEARTFFKVMVRELGSVLQVMLKLLPRMATPLDVRMLIAYVTNYDFQQIQHLKLLLGPLFRIFIGIPNGFYQLSLHEPNDRKAVSLLFQLSKKYNGLRKKEHLGDTSQLGNWSSFRNVMLDGHSILFEDKFFEDENLPEKGKLEFDFVLMESVSMKETEISNLRLFRVLTALGMVDPSKRKRIFQKLDLHRDEGRQVSKGLGNRKWELGHNAASNVAEHLEMFYHEDSLLNRAIAPYVLPPTQEETAVLEEKKKTKTSAISKAGGIKGSRQSQNRAPQPLATNSMNRSQSGLMDSPKNASVVMFQVPETPGERIGSMSRPGSSAVIGNELRTIDIYGQHIKEMMEQPTATADSGFIAMRIIDALEMILAGRFLTCAQLSLIIERLPGGNLKLHSLATYRVELIISLFSRIKDLINFDFVLKDLETVEIAMVIFRLGWLNVWNPLKAEGDICLNISRREERQVAKMLIALNFTEHGCNWLHPIFHETREEYLAYRATHPVKSFAEEMEATQDSAKLDIAGSDQESKSIKSNDTSVAENEESWTLPSTWLAEATLPQAGILALQYFSGKGVQMNSASPNVPVRMALMPFVLAAPYDEDLRHRSDFTVQHAENVLSKFGVKLVLHNPA